MNARLQSYLTKNENGKNIFKLEMTNLDCAEWLTFNCDIEIEYNKHPEMKKLIRELVSADVSPETEMRIIQHILSRVTTIEGIKNCKMYESYSMLNSDDIQRHHDDLLDFAMKSDTEPYIPFTSDKNSDHFKKFIKKLTPFFPYLDEVPRSHFEAIIAGHQELEEEYVQLFSNQSTFYEVDVPHGSHWYKFFMMKTDEISLFFYAKCEES
jgi:hypothetical protein